MRKSLKHFLPSGSIIASATMLLSSQGIAAQVTAADQGTPASSKSTPDSVAGATPEAAITNVGEVGADIVVTAQRRNENLQDVPISVSVIQPEQIQQLNLRTIENIQLVTPGLVFNTSYGFNQTFIRGVGSAFSTPGLEMAVPTYFDGAYLTRGEGAVFELLDIGSVQVLKGPQGTLFGRNATGGAILLTTANPTDKFEGHVAAEYGRFDHRQGEAVLNAPISDVLSIRLAGRYVDDGGYITNVFDGRKLGGRRSYTVRGKVRYQPSTDFSAILAVEHNDNKIQGRPVAQRLPASLCLGCTLFPGSGSPGYREVNNSYTPEVTSKATNVNLRLEGTSGDINLSSVTAYRTQDEFNPSDQDFTGAPLFNYNNFNGGKTFTQDLTMSTSSSGWANVLVGLSYLHDRAYYDLAVSGALFDPLASLPGGAAFQQNTVTTESTSAFGEVTISPIPRLKLIAGGRYTYDSRTLDGSANQAANLAFGGLPGILSFSQHQTFHSFTPRLVASYDTGPVNVYASFNEGFKAGGFISPTALARTPVKPEGIKSYEIGLKFVSPDRKLRANLAAFRYTYRNVQVSIIDVRSGGSITANAASAKGKGVEGDVQYKPADWLDVFGGGAYLRARYSNYPGAIGAGPGFDPATGASLGLVNTTEDLSGFTLPRAPKLTGYIGATLNLPLGDAWKVNLTGAARYTSRYDFVAGAGGPLRFDRQQEFVLVNMSGYVAPITDQFQIGFYVENLTDKHYAQQRQTSSPFGGMEEIGRPRTFGARARYNF